MYENLEKEKGKEKENETIDPKNIPILARSRTYFPLQSSKNKLPKPFNLIKVGSSFEEHELITANPFTSPRVDLNRVLNDIELLPCPWPNSLAPCHMMDENDPRKEFVLSILNSQYTFSRNIFKVIFNLVSEAIIDDHDVWIIMEKLLLLIRDNVQTLQEFKVKTLVKGQIMKNLLDSPMENLKTKPLIAYSCVI
jgi:hypothetical protein